MTDGSQRTGPGLRWRLVGVFSGVGPGLMVAGCARLVGELLALELGLASTVAMAIAIGGVVFLAAVLFVVLVLVARGGHPGGLTRQNTPAVAGFMLTAFWGAALLPGIVAAIVAVGLSVVVRMGVTAALLVWSRQTRPGR